MKWHEGRMVAVDTETTGTNPLEARIVTCAVVHFNPGDRPRIIEWVLDQGVDIPAEAAAVHGWTTEKLHAVTRTLDKTRRHADRSGTAIRTTDTGNRIRMTAEGALFEIAGHVASAMHNQAPLVVHNAAYDLTLLETELGRYDIDPLTSRPTGITGVVDPMVIEKQLDPYRRVKGGCRGGKAYDCGGCGAEDKTLTGLCRHYGIRHAGAHGASADAVAATRLLSRLVALWPQIGTWRLPTLHSHQVTWRAEQMDSLRAYFDKTGTPHDGCDPGWPIHTSLQNREAVA